MPTRMNKLNPTRVVPADYFGLETESRAVCLK